MAEKLDLISVLTKYTKYAKAYINGKIPTKMSQLENDVNFATTTEISNTYAKAADTYTKTEVNNAISEQDFDITEDQLKSIWDDTETDTTT